jgi:hypothetical protein
MFRSVYLRLWFLGDFGGIESEKQGDLKLVYGRADGMPNSILFYGCMYV